MVTAYHVTLGHYGFWLPNDGRGSGSFFVGSKRLLPYGEATGIENRRRSRAALPHDRTANRLAKGALKYPAVHLTGQQAWSVAQGFAAAVESSGFVIFACSILPQHTHLVIQRHSLPIEQAVIQLKAKASARLRQDGVHPFEGLGDRADGRLPTIWGRGKWDVYLSSPQQVRQKIAYVEENPEKQGLPRQYWKFVAPYRG